MRKFHPVSPAVFKAERKKHEDCSKILQFKFYIFYIYKYLSDKISTQTQYMQTNINYSVSTEKGTESKQQIYLGKNIVIAKVFLFSLIQYVSLKKGNI